MSIVVVFCFFTLIVSAQTFSFFDLSLFGIPSMTVCRKDSGAVCDGILSEGEYLSGVSFQEGSGLYLLSNGSYPASGKNLSGVKQDNYILLSDDTVYCALRLYMPAEHGSVAPIVKEFGTFYRISFSLGLTSGDHPALRGSLLTNTYYFSSEDFSCVGFTGERVARSVKEDSVFSRPLSSFSASYGENGITTSDGVLWNAEHYCNNTGFFLQTSRSGTTMIAEVKIPLEDVLLSVHPSQRESVRNALMNQSQTLCAGFSSRVDLDDDFCLVAGVPSQITMPDSTNGETLFAWMKNQYEKPISGFYVPDVIPIPLYWVGSAPPKQTFSLTASNDSLSLHESSAESKEEPSSEKAVSSADGFTLENDENIFASLPDADSKIPEETQIIYDEKATTSTAQKKDDNSLASSILSTVSGALLFASVMTICIYFRDLGKKSEKDEKKKKKKVK